MNLKPCPFCGNPNPVYWCYPEDGKTLFTQRWAVLCYYPDGGCGAEGSHQKSKEEATIAWNERQPQIIHCGECKYRFVDGDNVRFNMCLLNHNKVQADDWFCADGEKRCESD